MKLPVTRTLRLTIAKDFESFLNLCVPAEGLYRKARSKFACYLAEPAVPGGIVVALRQPSPSQVYDIPVDDIVEDCETLRALRELAEFFSLPFDKLSIFDAFPFITEQKHNQNYIDHSESHTTFHEMILEKQPRVILSGWASWPFRDFPTKSLQKLVIGALFPSRTIYYHGLTLSVVNMPHPSYYMNFCPTESCFRQLQILEFAQACGLLWGTWQEEAWMADLRGRCRDRARFLFNSKFDLSSIFICANVEDECNSSDEAFITERLTETLTQLEPLLDGVRYSFSSKAQIVDHLSKTNVLKLCSDASLILQRVDAIIKDGSKWVECDKASKTFICSWYDRRWPAIRESPELLVAGHRGIYAHSCFDQIPIVDLPRLARQIESCIINFAKKINLTWISLGNNGFKPDWEGQASAFFHLAKGIEDAMDEIPDNNRVLKKHQDRLVIMENNVQTPFRVNNQEIKVEHTVTGEDVDSDSITEGLRKLDI